MSLNIDVDYKSLYQLDFHTLVNEQLKTIEPYLKYRNNDYQYLVDIARESKENIIKLLANEEVKKIICHGDLHHGNMRFIGNDAIIFDFDFLGFGWKSYEVAVYLWSLLSNTETGFYGKTTIYRQLEAVMDGYNSVCELNPSEIESMKYWVVIRSIWLMGIQIKYLSRKRGISWINDSYFDYNINFLKNNYPRIIFNP